MLDTGVTAYLPFYGPVDWTPAQLSAKAAEWERVHVPVGRPLTLTWESPFVLVGRDHRPCAGCRDEHRAWVACTYAAWARLRRAVEAAG